MADILIKNMELPRTVTIYPNGDIDELVDGKYVTIGKAIELPEHGDLIDRNKLPITGITDYMNVSHIVIEFEDLKNASTIVEASK